VAVRVGDPDVADPPRRLGRPGDGDGSAAAAHLGRGVAHRWSSSNPRRIAALSLLAVLILLVIATGPVGIGLACLAAVVGLVPIALRVRRVHLMASLLVPVLLTYLGSAA